MDSVELPRQHLTPISEPPNLEEWKEQVRKATNDELGRLQQQAHLGLRGDGGNSQRWGIYISWVEGEMRDRGIKP